MYNSKPSFTGAKATAGVPDNGWADPIVSVPAIGADATAGSAQLSVFTVHPADDAPVAAVVVSDAPVVAVLLAVVEPAVEVSGAAVVPPEPPPAVVAVVPGVPGVAAFVVVDPLLSLPQATNSNAPTAASATKCLPCLPCRIMV